MDKLKGLINKYQKYVIQSKDKKIRVEFQNKDNRFYVEHIKTNSEKIIWIGQWKKYIDFLQLFYLYQVDNYGRCESINYLKSSKIRYEAGPHFLSDECTYQDKWIFNLKLFNESEYTVFYSLN